MVILVLSGSSPNITGLANLEGTHSLRFSACCLLAVAPAAAAAARTGPLKNSWTPSGQSGSPEMKGSPLLATLRAVTCAARSKHVFST